jgi:hypothetical protein
MLMAYVPYNSIHGGRNIILSISRFSIKISGEIEMIFVHAEAQK